MQVTAVVQLDRLLKKMSRLECHEIQKVLRGQISLLQRCHNIQRQEFIASLNASEILTPNLQAELGIRVITTLHDDPLDEFYRAANSSSATRSGLFEPLIVRIVPSLQNPDIEMIDAMILSHQENGYDYSRSSMTDDGIVPFIEVMNFGALDEAWREALLPDDREMITPYIYRQHARLNLGTYAPESSAIGMFTP